MPKRSHFSIGLVRSKATILLSRGVPVELFVTGTGTDIFDKNFAGTGTGTDIFHATCFLAFNDIVYSMPGRGSVTATVAERTDLRRAGCTTVRNTVFDQIRICRKLL